MSDSPFLWPDEGAIFTRQDVHPFLVWCGQAEVSDIYIQSNSAIFVRKWSTHYPATRKALSQLEIQSIFEEMTQRQVDPELPYQSFFYEASIHPLNRYRFRAQTAPMMNGSFAIAIRPIHRDPRIVVQEAQDYFNEAFDKAQGIKIPTSRL